MILVHGWCHTTDKHLNLIWHSSLLNNLIGPEQQIHFSNNHHAQLHFLPPEGILLVHRWKLENIPAVIRQEVYQEFRFPIWNSCFQIVKGHCHACRKTAQLQDESTHVGFQQNKNKGLHYKCHLKKRLNLHMYLHFYIIRQRSPSYISSYLDFIYYLIYSG